MQDIIYGFVIVCFRRRLFSNHERTKGKYVCC